MRYSDQTIDDIRLRTSLIELVSERTEVKNSGRSHVACCPFHSEKSPSFHINEDQGLYYCFGCGKKGNTYTFVMETRGLTFPEAVRYLAHKTGISLPVEDLKTSEFEKGFSRKKGLYRKILLETQNLYEDILWGRGEYKKEGAEVWDFLRNRSISEQIIKKFRLGYTGSSQGVLFPSLFKIISSSLKINEHELLDALSSIGLIKTYENERRSELFRDRVMFPISKSDGSPIAFGGRILDSNSEFPKYINSLESPVYEKRRSFYGLAQGFPPSQKLKNAFIVEGYTDVLSLSQIGIENTLAVCGTALTEDHTKILSRFVNRVYLVFDGDSAGVLASSRSFKAFINSGIEAIPIFLPDGEDPDSLAREVSKGSRTIESLNKIFESGKSSLLKIYLQSVAATIQGLQRGALADLNDLKASEHGKLADNIASVLVQIKNPVEREIRVKETCEILGVSDQSLRSLLKDRSYSFKSRTSYKASNEGIERTGAPLNSENHADSSPSEHVPSSQSPLLQRRMGEIRKQLILASLVDPRILKSDLIYQEASDAAKGDEKVENLFSILRNEACTLKASDPSYLAKGLSVLLEGDIDKNEEVLAKYYGVLTRCGLEKEGFLDEAIQQLTLGGDSHQLFMNDLSETLARIRLSDEVDGIRMKEGASKNSEDHLKLVQEKLLMKRSLARLKPKEL
jgi:DNA primase catalytic core